MENDDVEKLANFYSEYNTKYHENFNQDINGEMEQKINELFEEEDFPDEEVYEIPKLSVKDYSIA